MADLELVLRLRVASANAAFISQQLLQANEVDGPDESSEYTPVFDDQDAVAPIVFRMHYIGADGKKSERTVRLLKIASFDKDFRVYAWCYHRNAYRSFLLSRMTEISDITTGEVFDDPYAFFVDCGVFRPETAEAHAVRQCMDELIILAFVGACDGLFHPAEKDEAVKHVFDRVWEPLDEEKVRKLLGAIAPDEKAFERALKKVSLSSPDVRRITWRSVRRVIDADGRVHLSEATIAEHIHDVLAVP